MYSAGVLTGGEKLIKIIMRDVHVSVELLIEMFCSSGGGRRRRAECGAQNAFFYQNTGLFKDSSVSVGLIRYGRSSCELTEFLL